MRALGRTSAQFRRARGYSDEGAGLRPLAFQRFIGADTAGKIALGSRSRQPVPLASAPCGAAGRAGVRARVSRTAPARESARESAHGASARVSARSQRASQRTEPALESAHATSARCARTHHRCTRGCTGRARTAVTAARAEGVRRARRRRREPHGVEGHDAVAHGGSGEARPVSRGRAECNFAGRIGKIGQRSPGGHRDASPRQ